MSLLSIFSLVFVLSVFIPVFLLSIFPVMFFPLGVFSAVYFHTLHKIRTTKTVWGSSTCVNFPLVFLRKPIENDLAGGGPPGHLRAGTLHGRSPTMIANK